MTYLFIWTILAGGASWQSSVQWKSGWVNSGEFEFPSSCHRAAENLGLPKTQYRCITKLKGELK